MHPKQNSPHLFRRCITFLSAVALLLSAVSVAGDTWAWFTDNQSASVSEIRSAQFKMAVSVYQETAAVETAYTEASAVVTEATDDEGNPCFDLNLPKGSTYCIQLNAPEDSTATKGYCLISGDADAYTGNIVGVESGYQFKIDLTGDTPAIETVTPIEKPAAGDEDLTNDDQKPTGDDQKPAENDPKPEGGDTVPGGTDTEEIPEAPTPLTDSPVDTYFLRLTPIWGAFPAETYGDTVFGFGVGGPMCVENGAIVNEYCENIGTYDPSQPLTIVSGSYTAVSEHNIPLYYQNDYPNNRYGAGSIATSGCGIVSLAMIATYMTGHQYDPVELARWFGGRAENNIQRMEIGATTLGLPWVKAENINEATDALHDGKIVIMMMDGFNFPNPFTTSQHFVVVRGITADDRYLIDDPNRSNYKKWELEEGFEKGFARDTLVAGYSGAWIFDPEGLPEDFVPYVKEEYPRQDNYPGVELTFEEQELLAKLIWAEARGECDEGQQAVAEVVLNRLVSGKFGSSIAGIIVPSQFRGCEKIEEATPWQAQYDAIDAARYGKPVLEKDVFYFATTALTSQVYATIDRHVFCRDELDGSIPVITPEIPEPEAPKPEVTTPETPAPETPAPETPAPEIPETEVTTPETGTEEQTDASEPTMPNYYLSDYPGIPYAEGTIEDSGSSIVSLAMVAAHMTGYEYTPDMLAAWFTESGEDDIERLETAADTLALPWAEPETIEEAFEAISEDQFLILRLESTEDSVSVFTSGVHFLVVHGMTEDGRYLVNDPDKANSENEELLEGFENGFALEDLLTACTHAWVFDPAGIPEDYAPYAG